MGRVKGGGGGGGRWGDEGEATGSWLGAQFHTALREGLSRLLLLGVWQWVWQWVGLVRAAGTHTTVMVRCICGSHR